MRGTFYQRPHTVHVHYCCPSNGDDRIYTVDNMLTASTVLATWLSVHTHRLASPCQPKGHNPCAQGQSQPCRSNCMLPCYFCTTTAWQHMQVTALHMHDISLSRTMVQQPQHISAAHMLHASVVLLCLIHPVAGSVMRTDTPPRTSVCCKQQELLPPSQRSNPVKVKQRQQ